MFISSSCCLSALFVSWHEWHPTCNKLWCESTTNPASVLRIAASCGFSELTKNVIRSTHGHYTPSLKISRKSVWPFSRNFADRETNKEINKQINKEFFVTTGCPGVRSFLNCAAYKSHHTLYKLFYLRTLFTHYFTYFLNCCCLYNASKSWAIV